MKSILIFTYLLLVTSIFYAQETSGTIQGVLKDKAKNPIPFATIQITDVATNFKYGTVSQENGFYIITNLSPSDNYQLEISYLGYKTITEGKIIINLGDITVKDFILLEDSVGLDEVVLNGSKSRKKNGNEVVLGQHQIKNTPTINRSIQDLTKNLSENNLNSFGGASNRFNNLNIDGIANNDVIGFQEPASGASGSSANGTPGSLSRTQPIGLGAIKQLSVKLTPFDVSIGNFSGANINLVTKNGTNTFKGEVYGYGNNQLLLGNYANGIKQETPGFYDIQLGIGAGGALIKDKLFYYVNIEQAFSDNPVLNAPGSATSNIELEDVQAISEHLINVYGYDPGTYTKASVKTASTKIFTRLDYNISDLHKLTLRNNYINSCLLYTSDAADD